MIGGIVTEPRLSRVVWLGLCTGAVLVLLAPAGVATVRPAVELVADINPAGSAEPGPAVVVGDHLYFSAGSVRTGTELWRTDGRVTELVADINPGGGSSSPESLAAFGGHLYFSADDARHGVELWRTDGSRTTLVLSLIHISEPTRQAEISYAVFCLKKKK